MQGPYVYDGASRSLALRSAIYTISVDQVVSAGSGRRYYCASYYESVAPPGCVVTFTYVYQCLLTISVVGGGYTDPPPTSYWCDKGSSVNVLAQPFIPSWEFDHWELDGVNVGSQNPYTVTMNAPHTLTAVFKFVA